MLITLFASFYQHLVCSEGQQGGQPPRMSWLCLCRACELGNAKGPLCMCVLFFGIVLSSLFLMVKDLALLNHVLIGILCLLACSPFLTSFIFSIFIAHLCCFLMGCGVPLGTSVFFGATVVCCGGTFPAVSRFRLLLIIIIIISPCTFIAGRKWIRGQIMIIPSIYTDESIASVVMNRSRL